MTDRATVDAEARRLCAEAGGEPDKVHVTASYREWELYRQRALANVYGFDDGRGRLEYLEPRDR